MKKINILSLLILFFLSACSKNENEISVIKETRQDLEMISCLQEGL